MSDYAYPVGDIYVPADWANHKNRNPPSPEPGTDYASAYGTTAVASDAGTVAEVKTSSSGGTGRYVKINLDDGRATRSLHLASCSVSVGQRVSRGQKIGVSGASGYGSDWYYGSHLHQTLLPAYNTALSNSIDFGLYVDQEEDMPTIQEIHDVMVSVLRAPEFDEVRIDRIAAATLARKVSDETGTLAQTTRDARQISRRTEIEVQELTALVTELARKAGLDPEALLAGVAAKVDEPG